MESSSLKNIKVKYLGLQWAWISLFKRLQDLEKAKTAEQNEELAEILAEIKATQQGLLAVDSTLKDIKKQSVHLVEDTEIEELEKMRRRWKAIWGEE